jgi:hypothetical protein
MTKLNDQPQSSKGDLFKKLPIPMLPKHFSDFCKSLSQTCTNLYDMKRIATMFLDTTVLAHQTSSKTIHTTKFGGGWFPIAWTGGTVIRDMVASTLQNHLDI